MLYWIIAIYVAWSFYGLLIFKGYLVNCQQAKKEPFNGSFLAFFVMSFLCGAFTFLQVVSGLFEAVVEFIKELKNK